MNVHCFAQAEMQASVSLEVHISKDQESLVIVDEHQACQ